MVVKKDIRWIEIGGAFVTFVMTDELAVDMSQYHLTAFTCSFCILFQCFEAIFL